MHAGPEKYIPCFLLCAKDLGSIKPADYKFILRNHAFHTVSTDVLEPLAEPSSIKGNRYTVVAIDHLTKLIEVRALPSQTSIQIPRFIYKDIICRHGYPQTILTDKASNFFELVLLS